MTGRRVAVEIDGASRVAQPGAGPSWRDGQDLKTPLPRKLIFRESAYVFEIAERGGCTLNLEGRQAIEHDIEIGRGGIWLNLTEDQYAKLTNH